MYRVVPDILGQRERREIEAARNMITAPPPHVIDRTMSQQFDMAAKMDPNSLTTVQLHNAFGNSGVSTITGTNDAVRRLLRAIEEGLQPQQDLPASFGDAVGAAFAALQTAGLLAPPEVIQQVMIASPAVPADLYEVPNSSVFNPASLAAPLHALRQTAMETGVQEAYGMLYVTKNVDGSHSVEARFTKSGARVIGTALLYREMAGMPGSDMQSEFWRAFVREVFILHLEGCCN